MRHLFVTVCAVLLWGCHRQAPSTSQRIAKFKASDPVSALVNAMSLEKYELRNGYNLPPGKESSHYYLPDGDLYFDSENPSEQSAKFDEHAWVLSSPPCFEPSQVPAAQRVAESDKASVKAWDEYVRKHTGR